MEPQNGPDASAKSGQLNLPVMIIILAILVIVLGVFIVYFISASGQISAKNSQISDLNGRVGTLEVQMASDNAQIAALLSQVGTSSPTGTVQNLQAQIDSLNSQLTSTNGQISQLQNQVKASAAQASDLQTQLTAANTRLMSFQTLSNSSTPADAVQVNQPPAQETPVASFSAGYAGYILVTATSTISGSYIRVTDSFGNYSLNDYQYDFGAGTSVLAPVLPGVVNIYLGNGSTIGGVTATVTVQYYY